MATDIAFVNIPWRERTVRIEHAWLAPERTGQPLMVFLHEGLGSLAMWKDFPRQLCDALGCRGLVYSRPGYGRSTPHATKEVWDLDYMHQQAHEVLPALLQALHVEPTRDRLWLFGHSDGGSIALLFAATAAPPLGGAIVLAPHILVEDLSVASIEKSRQAYLHTDLPTRLARHHDDADFVFWRWNRIWLHPAFRRWSIEDQIGAITCPLLAIQGQNDPYGTLEQIHGIARRAPQTRLCIVPDCGHSPHRDQPDTVITDVSAFFALYHTV